MVLNKVTPNAYKVDLCRGHYVSATFNVADWRLYFDEDDELPSLRINSFQVEGDDEDQVQELPKPKEV